MTIIVCGADCTYYCPPGQEQAVGGGGTWFGPCSDSLGLHAFLGGSLMSWLPPKNGVRPWGAPDWGARSASILPVVHFLALASASRLELWESGRIEFQSRSSRFHNKVLTRAEFEFENLVSMCDVIASINRIIEYSK